MSTTPIVTSAKVISKPNIIVILSDDAGYKDFGFTGSKEFKTPNLDKLATQGTVFTNAYVASSVCGPSRAGLLTGKYPQRYGFLHNNVPGCVDKKAGLYGRNMGLPLNQKTIADYLKSAGYTSMIVGKWHQGHAMRFHPLNRGFDEFYGFLGGARNYFATQKVSEEHRLWHNMDTLPEPETYLTDLFAEKSCDFIKSNRRKPFFLFLSFNAVHSPYQAKERDIKKFSQISKQRRTLAAMTWSMDEAIGKVLSQVKKSGIEENTIIIFLNDNGGVSYYGADNSPFSGCKSTYLEGGIRVPFIIKWPKKLASNSTYKYPITLMDILPTMLSAAGVNYKSELFDGVDILPYLTSENYEKPHKTLYWKGDGPFSAMREDNWKLIKMPDRLPELYNLDNDSSEINNLANDYPEITKRLLKKLYDWEFKMAQPRWQLKKMYEKYAIKRFDSYRK